MGEGGVRSMAFNPSKKNQDFLLLLYMPLLFPVWLKNRLISAGLEPVLSHTVYHVKIICNTILEI